MRTRVVSERCWRQFLDELFDDRMFADLRTHGNSVWSLRTLVVLALTWAISGEVGLVERFHQTLAVLSTWRCRGLGATTYQGFMKALLRWTGPLRPRLLARLQQRARELDEPRPWQLFAVDGTRLAVPRTLANQAACQSRRRKSPRIPRLPAQPQLWLTVLWNMNLGLPWDWRVGPTGSSEREHLEQMLDALPARSLLVADAGFQGYRYWRALHERQQGFVIRVGSNVRLLRQLGQVRTVGDRVALWPDRERRRGRPPLWLQLYELQGPRSTIFVVTNVLNRTTLTPQQVADCYRRRWGIELFFRDFKQTFGRRQLRSHAPQQLACELEWSLLGWTCLELLAVRATLAAGAAPGTHSPRAVLLTLRDELQQDAAEYLRFWLVIPRNDGYPRRRKSIRAWPSKKPYTPAGKPRVITMNREQLHDCKQLPTNT